MDPYIGEIRLFAGSFAPRGWAFCEGQLLPISQNTALFSILGTMYGGDGRVTFALPDLRDRVPMQEGTGPGLTPRSIGEEGGNSTVTLLQTEIPKHMHLANCQSSTNGVASPSEAIWSGTTGRFGPPAYADAPNASMGSDAIAPAGGSAPHNNRQPTLGVNFIIALIGEFPPRS